VAAVHLRHRDQLRPVQQQVDAEIPELTLGHSPRRAAVGRGGLSGTA
jgi:hypothetical protein